jgi:hypothetical protein
MPGWGWFLVALGAVIVIGLVGWMVWQQRRSRMLRQRFGPEYDRVVSETGGVRRKAESELDSRRKRRDDLDIRPLDPAARQRYMETWRTVQARFVDAPSQAIGEADALVLQVMRERGYPMDDFDQRAADISVDYPGVVENYRAAHAISMADQHGKASTEDMRQAVVHYRSLFEDLLGGKEYDTEREVR